jgi:hypothetical protein
MCSQERTYHVLPTTACATFDSLTNFIYLPAHLCVGPPIVVVEQPTSHF